MVTISLFWKEILVQEILFTLFEQNLSLIRGVVASEKRLERNHYIFYKWKLQNIIMVTVNHYDEKSIKFQL